MEKFTTALNVVAALLFAGGTAMLGFTIPSIWTLQSDVGGIKATLVSIDKRLDGIDKKLDGLDDKLALIAKRADSIDMHLAARETDPAAIVAQSGLRPETEFGGVRVGQKVYALPKTDKAAAELAKAGAVREAITPSAFGYVLGTIDGGGKFIGMVGAAMHMSPDAVPDVDPKTRRPRAKSE